MPIETHTLPWNYLIPWPELNARKRFLEEDLGELTQSIREDGMVNPLLVRMNEQPPHWIIAGERRWLASRGILKDVPVLVRNLTEEQAIRINLTENIQRSNLTPMEEAHGLSRYMETSGMTQVEVAEVIGKTQGWVSQRLRLLRLPKALEELFDEGAFTQSQARDMILPFASLPDKEWKAFSSAVTRAVKKTYKKVDRGLTEEEIREPASKAAMAMSGWLDHYNWQEDNKAGFEGHLRIPKARWMKAPTGTIINFLYGQYPHDRSTRAFDMDWWQGEMELAKTRYAEAVERRNKEIEKGEGPGEDGPDLDWTPALGKMPAHLPIPHYQLHVVYCPVSPEPDGHDYVNNDTLSSQRPGDVRRKGNLFADPTEIPDGNLVFRLREGGGYFWQPQILCTDNGIFESAVEALVAKRDQLTDRRVKRQAETDIKASASIKLPEAIPSLLALGTTLKDEDFLTQAGEDLEISPTWHEYQEKVKNIGDFGTLSWAVQMQTYLAGLRKEYMQAIAKVLVYRLTRSDSGGELAMRRHVRESVCHEIRCKLTAELGKRIELPEWTILTKEAADDEKD